MNTIKALDLPFGKFRDKGTPIDNVSNYDSKIEDAIYVASQSELNLYRLIFVTKQSMMKVVSGGEFDVTRKMVAATKLADDDKLVSVQILTDLQSIVLKTRDGYFLRFSIDEIPEKGKTAIGVRGMKLSGTDYVEGVYYLNGYEDYVMTDDIGSVTLNNLKNGKRDSKGTKIKR